MIGRFILVIVPLLSLMADQMTRIVLAIQMHGSVEARHLNDMEPNVFWKNIIPSMNKIGFGMMLVLFLFFYPQFLAENRDILSAFLRCHQQKMLHLVAIDEEHLYVIHGCSFQNAIQLLLRLFFSIVFKDDKWHPLFLAMTATITLLLLSSFSGLTNAE